MAVSVGRPGRPRRGAPCSPSNPTFHKTDARSRSTPPGETSSRAAEHVEDRAELGRWISGDTDVDKKLAKAKMPNLYADDRQRGQCINTRRRVADVIRSRIERHFTGNGGPSARSWWKIPLEGGGYECLVECMDDCLFDEVDVDTISEGSDSENEDEIGVIKAILE